MPDVVVAFGGLECGPHQLPSGQTFSCHFGVNADGSVVFRFGAPPQRLKPDAYVGGGRTVAQLLTLEADGGTSFACSEQCRNATLPRPE